MSQNKRNYGQASYEKRRDVRYGRNREAYIYGNTARKLDIKHEIDNPEIIEQPGQYRRHKTHHMTVGYVVFLVAALLISGYILVNYVQLQAELTNRTRAVAAKERELNSMKIKNDEEFNRVTNSVNLEDIKRIAIGELGMTYAEEGQIILYSNDGSDYMRSVAGE